MAQKLDILVLLRECGDPLPPARVIHMGAGIDDRGLRMFPNPGDLSALEEALCLADKYETSVTAVAIGFVSSVVPALGASRTPIVDALRSSD